MPSFFDVVLVLFIAGVLAYHLPKILEFLRKPVDALFKRYSHDKEN